MSAYGPKTGFSTKDAVTGSFQDLGDRYISTDYLLDVYENIVPSRMAAGLWTWGNNSYITEGMLGTGDFPNSRSSPAQVGALTSWRNVSVGGLWMHAVKSDGTLWAWGGNSYGALGIGTTVGKSSPVQVGALTNWKRVFNTGSSVYAVKTDNSLWSWGTNSAGQLGTGSTANRSSPAQVGALVNWKLVASNGGAALAIKTDGTLWSWGENYPYGVLGNGTTANRSSPVQVGALTNWRSVSVGSHHVIATKTDGTLWAWGQGAGATFPSGPGYSSPVQIGALTDWKLVSAAYYTSLAIKTDGTLWAWGINSYGTLGLSTTTDIVSSPVQVGTLTNWKQINAGGAWVLAIKTDGTLWSWGANSYGLLGQNWLSGPIYSPVQVGSDTKWTAISGSPAGAAAISKP